MKAKLAVIALGALVLMANGANAMIRIDPRKTRPRVLVGKVLVGFALAAFLISVPPTWGGIGPAAAQERVSVSAEFRLALEPYGAWHHNGRFGDVWVATGHQNNWRPYTAGHWISTLARARPDL